MSSAGELTVRKPGTVEYTSTLDAMRGFTASRDVHTPDELWLLQHPPVFTLGQAGKPAHVLAPVNIPVVQADRGGQVTYHGPGQWVLYLLLDIRRRQLGVRDLVTLIENTVIALLAGYGIESHARPDAPGVYVGDEKIAALGLRVRRGCSYHGLSLNVAMDLEPFSRINPCGHAGLRVTSMAKLLPGTQLQMDDVGVQLLAQLQARLDNHRGGSGARS